MQYNQLTHLLTSNPRKLFLIDGIGAIISSIMLGIVLVKLKGVVGIPASTLYILALFPVLFALYDFYCYRFERKSLGTLLYVIGGINLLYCYLSAGFGFYHIETITWLGSSYLILEILIVSLLAFIEIDVAKRLSNQEKQN